MTASPIREKAAGQLILLVLAAGFVAGIVYLFGIQFAAGDVFPEYSSLRTDQMGTRLLFDSLAGMPSVTVERNYLPLDALSGSGRTVLLLGLNPEQFGEDDEGLERLEQFARRGNRVVAAMAPAPGANAPMALPLDRKWHVRFGGASNRKQGHPIYFTEARDWTVLDRIGNRLLAIERDFGSGSVALFADSNDFTNEATAASDRLELVSLALGVYSRITFDEQHLGIAESGSFVGLARRFHLTGLVLGLAICAGLFLWRSASSFPPQVESADPTRLSGRPSLSGLLTLLRRHMPPDQLAKACLEQWLASNRRKVTPERLARATAMAARTPGGPLEAVREMQAVLQSKGNL